MRRSIGDRSTSSAKPQVMAAQTSSFHPKQSYNRPKTTPFPAIFGVFWRFLHYLLPGTHCEEESAWSNPQLERVAQKQRLQEQPSGGESQLGELVRGRQEVDRGAKPSLGIWPSEQPTAPLGRRVYVIISEILDERRQLGRWLVCDDPVSTGNLSVATLEIKLSCGLCV